MADQIVTGTWNLWRDQQRDSRLEELAEALGLLQRELTRRVQREEGSGGFFFFLCSAAPRYLSFVGTLQFQHTRLLNALAALRAKAERASSDHYAELMIEAAVVLAAIEDHDALEREVLRDALESV